MSYSDLERSIDPHPAETAVTGLFCLSVVWLSAVSIKRYFETGKIGSPVDHPAAASLVLLSLAGMQAFEIKRSLANGVAQLASPPGLRGSMDFSRRSNPVCYWAAVGVQFVLLGLFAALGCGVFAARGVVP